MKRFLSFVLLIAAAAAAKAVVLSRQTLVLRSGWNAVYAEVAPTGSLDQVFANWPVESVGLYDADSFLETRQFSPEGETLGITAVPFAMWNRDNPEASNAKTLAAGTVLVYFGTNSAPVATTLTGVPAAPRNRWHASGGDTVFNYVGFSIAEGARVAPADYLDGFGGVYLSTRKHYRVFGTDKTKPPMLVQTTQTTTVGDGDVLVMHSDDAGDFSGTLRVSPAGGVVFGTETAPRTLRIRNDGTRARTASVTFLPGVEEKAIAFDIRWLHVRDLADVATNAAWTACSDSLVARKRLAPGETWQLQFGLDRSALADRPSGIPFGAILRVADEDGGSSLRADVPVEAETEGGTARARAWPAGLWVGDVAFDKIAGPGEANASETGGALKLRLPLHVDAEGRVRLLQRVVAAGSAEADGSYNYRLYAGGASVPATATQAMRISAVCLPTEIPVVEAAPGGLVFAGGAGVAFEFTVAAGGATSLLRHPLHPLHDGLRWDFKTPAPDGDDPGNYKYDVKPETFSVGNRIELSLDLNGGEATWNPEETKSGTARWTLTGLRHEGPITLSGPMTLRRVAPVAELVLE